MFGFKIPEAAGVFIGTLLLSLILTPIIRKIALKSNKVEKVKSNRWHQEPIPIFGGVAIWASWSLVTFWYLHSNQISPIPIIFTSMIFILGFYDDLFQLNPIMKLIGQIAVASVIVKMGFVIEIIPYPMISIPLTILWIVGITNAFNLLDNMDGLSAGVAMFTSLSLFLLSLQSGDTVVSILAIGLVGSSLGFLKYNFYPAKIFMGDSGSMFLGTALAIISIMGTWRHASNLLITIIVPLLVLGVPIFDTVFVSITRKLRGVPLSHGGIDHISHRLVALGMSQKRAVLTLYFFSAFMGGIAVYYNKLNPFVILIGVTLLVICLFCFGLFLGEMEAYSKDSRFRRNLESYRKLEHYKNKFVGFSKRRMVEMVMDLVLITVSFFSSYLIRFEGNLPPQDIYYNMVDLLPLVIIIKLILLYYFGCYKSLWKYVGTGEVLDILKALVVSTFIITGFVYYKYQFIDFSKTVFIIDWMMSVLLICGFRFSLRMFREYMMKFKMGQKKVIIIGAGDAGALLLKEIQNNPEMDYSVAGFIDDNPMKQKMKINGVTVLGSIESLPIISKDHSIKEVLIAIPSASKATINRISNICQQSGLDHKTLPRIYQMLEKT